MNGMTRRFSPGWGAGWLLSAVLGAASAQAAFEVTGQVPASWPNGTVTLSRESLEKRTSTPVKTETLAGGRFRLQTDAEAGLYTLSIGEAEVSLVAGEGDMLRVTLEGTGKLRVEGGEAQALYAAYEAVRTESLKRLVTPVRDAAAKVAGNEAEEERLAQQEVSAYVQHRHELNDFTLAKLRGSAALYAASLRWDGDYRLEELASAVSDYAKSHTGTEIARLLEERIGRFRVTAIGAMAPELKGPGPDGKETALSGLRGRHVLVDFWASWCAPCRIENRSYAQLYRQHRNAGFEILAVSVDQSERGWRAAIAKDDAAWRHISDLSGWKSPYAAAYNVTALPANFLLDPEGRIVAKDVRGKQLAALLAGGLKPAAAKE
jgi:peroxiredoxin